MSARKYTLAAAVLGAALAAPGVAGAATPSPWSSLKTSGQLDISDVIGTTRDASNNLHVAWFSYQGDNTYDLFQTPVTPTGTVGTPTPIVTGWAGLQGPSLLSSGSSLLAFFSGTRTITTGDPTTGLDASVSSDGGATWSQPTAAIDGADDVYGRNTSEAIGPNGLLAAWYSIGNTVVHVGTDPTVPDQTGYTTGQNQAIAVSGNSALVAWCSSITAPYGVYVQPVDTATGAPAAAAQVMPSTPNGINTYCPSGPRTQLVARQGQGYFVAGVNGNRHTVLGWPVGAKESETIAVGSSMKQDVAAAASPGPSASVWVAWVDGDFIKLRRSNASATVFGGVVTLPAPQGTVLGLDLNAQADRVDLVARVSAPDNTVSLVTAQTFPALSLDVADGKTPKLTVTDAGVPVAGAKVTVGGHSDTTNAKGVVSFSGLAPGKYAADASMAKYVDAKGTVKVPMPVVHRHHPAR